jgi:hypothetical protein
MLAAGVAVALLVALVVLEAEVWVLLVFLAVVAAVV